MSYKHHCDIIIIQYKLNGGINLEEKNEDKINQIFDLIFKRSMTLSQTAIVYFMNGLFNKNFPIDSSITYLWNESVNDNLKHIIADVMIIINNDEKFHIEAQINNDSTIALRVFEYGYQEALKYRKTSGNEIVLKFPKPQIIFLEHNANTPDEAELILDFWGEEIVHYKVPTTKLLALSIEELNEKHMIILMPLYLLKLRKEINDGRKKGRVLEQAPKLKALMNDGILKSIDSNREAGNITRDDALVLVKLLNKLYNYLYGDIEEFRSERIDEMLAEKYKLDFEIEREEAAKEAREQGIMQGIRRGMERGMERGIEQGQMDIVKKLLERGMSVEEIQELTGLSTEKIKGLHE